MNTPDPAALSLAERQARSEASRAFSVKPRLPKLPRKLPKVDDATNQS